MVKFLGDPGTLGLSVKDIGVLALQTGRLVYPIFCISGSSFLAAARGNKVLELVGLTWLLRC